MKGAVANHRSSMATRVAPTVSAVLTMVFAYGGTHRDASGNLAVPSRIY